MLSKREKRLVACFYFARGMGRRGIRAVKTGKKFGEISVRCGDPGADIAGAYSRD